VHVSGGASPCKLGVYAECEYRTVHAVFVHGCSASRGSFFSHALSTCTFTLAHARAHGGMLVRARPPSHNERVG
jgi:hypothetical protein